MITSISNIMHMVQWDGLPADVPAAGTAYFTIDLTTGNVSYYPNGSTQNGTFTYTLTNSRGSSNANVQFNIKTDAPIGNPDSATVAGYTTGQTPTSVIIPIESNDVSHDPNFIGWSMPVISGLPAGATATVVQIGTNSFGQPIWGVQYTPAAGQVTGPNQAPYQFQYNETEMLAGGGTGKSTGNTNVYVTVVNQPTANDDAYTVPQNSGPTTLNVLNNDSSAGSPITIQSVNVTNGTTANGGSVYISDDGMTLIYQPAHGFSGNDTFTYTIIDGNGKTSTATVTVNVPMTPNRPPVANPDVNTPIPNTQTFPSGDSVTENDFDPDGDPLTVTQIQSTTGGTVPVPANPLTPVMIVGQYGTLTIGSDGSYTYQVDTTNPTVAGLPINGTINDVFTYTITDGNGGFDSTTLTIPITRPDLPPVAVDDAYTTGAGMILTVPAATGVLANDFDPDAEDQGHLMVASINGDPTAVGQQITLPSGALVTVNPDGSFSYNPNGKFDDLAPSTTGTDSFTYAVTDPHGMVATATAVITITPPVADLALAKTVSNLTPNVGDTITFTVTLTNKGPDPATGVTVQDTLPAGVTLVSATPSQGTYVAASGVWTVGTVTTAAPQTLTVTAKVTSPNPQTNSATVSHSNVFDPNTSNNAGSVTETPQQADLKLTKTVDNATPNVGDTITFTVTLSDLGPDAATNVTVQDLLPAGLTFVSATPAPGTTYNNTTGVWTVGMVTTTATTTLAIRALVNSAAPQTNMASISHSDQFDPSTGNNSAVATATPQQADLAVNKTVSNPTPNVGDTITYTITLTDAGPDPATNVTVQDTLPAGVMFVSSTPSQGNYNAGTGVWTVGTVTPGTPQTLTITATVTSANPAANVASVSHSDQFDPNTANNSNSASTNPQQADLAIMKTVSNPTPNVGASVTFTVTLTNTGPSAASGVLINDLLPAGLTFVSAAPSQGTYDSVGGVWTVGALANGAQATLALQALVVASSARTNTASISHSDQFDPNPGNNTASTTETPQRADLQLTKTVDNPTPNVGDTITYTVTLADLGPDAATNVTVQDLLPAGLMFVSATPSQGTYSSSTGAWAVGTVTTAAPQTLRIQATVVSASAQTNMAAISHSDQFDPNTGNNTASVTATPQQADLAITKAVSDATPNVGDMITYTVTVTNNGPDAATGVTISEPIPAGLSFVNALPSKGVYSNVSGVWTLGTLSNGASAVLTITALVVSPTVQINTALVMHSDQFDPTPGNNTASTTETPQQADLALTKAVDNPTPNVGDNVIFTVTLTDNGPNPATGVQVLDMLPAGLSLVSVTPSQGTYSSTTGVWTVGTVDLATPLTLTLTARVNSPFRRTNTATISAADQFDPVSTNNSASASETPQRADLVVTKTVDHATPNVGDTITFDVTVSNSGPDAATGVVLSDLLPNGLFPVGDTPSQGTYTPSTGFWTVGTLANGGSATLHIQAQVLSPVAQTNTASVIHSDQFDPQTGNNTGSATATPQQADLRMAKSVSDPTPNVGETITYTLILSNSGPDSATNVTVQDDLPAGVAYVSSTPSQGSFNATTGEWTVGTVTTSTPATLIITARVTSPNPEANTATVSHSDQFDPTTGDQTDTASITPQEADLVLGKAVSDATPNVGDTITYTLTLKNTGPADATNVQVTDRVPAGMAFVASTPSQGSYDSATGLWTVGTVPNGAVATLAIQATVVTPAAKTNTATVTHPTSSTPLPTTTRPSRHSPRSRPTSRSRSPSTTRRPTWETR
jgi:uncharacterized repeat protein (TIGR01451 family)